MKNSVFALTAATIALAGSTAFAGGLTATVVEPTVTPAVVPVATIVPSDWSGFYVGGAVGTGDVEGFDSETGDSIGESDDLTTYGLFAGYNYDLGNFVIGADASYDKVDIDEADDDVDTYVARLGARAGYDVGAFLPYVTAGFAMLDTDIGFGNTSDTGYYYGIGADYRVTDSIVIGGQYLRHEFDDFDDSGIDLEADVAQLRVAYQF